jgi:tRNA G46 methylase TrmB
MNVCKLSTLVITFLDIVILSYGFHISKPFIKTQRLVFLCKSTNYFALEECWKSDTSSVNPFGDDRIDRILQRLCSPAPQSYYVIKRALATTSPSESLFTLQQLQYLLKSGFQFAYIGRDFDVVQLLTTLPSDWFLVDLQTPPMSTLSIAHTLLSLLQNSISNDEEYYATLRTNWTHLAKQRLQLTLGTDIRGRSSADAAFLFALAGLTDDELFNILAAISYQELHRSGMRQNFRSKGIVHMMEKLAASGIRKEQERALFTLAADILEAKREHLDTANYIRKELYFFSTRSLLWLWRYSSRQPKISYPPICSETKVPWMNNYSSCDKSLVVDIGCGMGVSLLALATLSEEIESLQRTAGFLGDLEPIQNSNCIGCDSNPLLVGFAHSIAFRWKILHRLQFICQDGRTLLEDIDKYYPGNVSIIMIQFPSPYSLNETRKGNHQLPSRDSSFMASEALFQTAYRTLSNNGLLILQSNVEDVAVYMFGLAKAVGFHPLSCPNPCTLDDLNSATITQRSLKWMKNEHDRACGEFWSDVPLLPRNCATETEVACQEKGQRIHRCILQAVKGISNT